MPTQKNSAKLSDLLNDATLLQEEIKAGRMTQKRKTVLATRALRNQKADILKIVFDDMIQKNEAPLFKLHQSSFAQTAVWSGKPEIARMLVPYLDSKTLNISFREDDDDLLLLAARQGKVAIMNFLLHELKNPLDPNKDKCMALAISIEQGQMGATKALLNNSRVKNSSLQKLTITKAPFLHRATPRFFDFVLKHQKLSHVAIKPKDAVIEIIQRNNGPLFNHVIKDPKTRSLVLGTFGSLFMYSGTGGRPSGIFQTLCALSKELSNTQKKDENVLKDIRYTLRHILIRKALFEKPDIQRGLKNVFNTFQDHPTLLLEAVLNNSSDHVLEFCFPLLSKKNQAAFLKQAQTRELDSLRHPVVQAFSLKSALGLSEPPETHKKRKL